MSHTERLLNLPETFRRLTGLDTEAFRSLLPQVEVAFRQARVRRGDRPGRRRKPGAGRQFVLPVADQLLLLLIYSRSYVSHAFLAFLFGINDSTVCRNLRRLEPLLAGIFRIPECKIAIREDEIKELFFDGTERPTRGPPGRSKDATTPARRSGRRSRASRHMASAR
jgi:hypothetical protein